MNYRVRRQGESLGTFSLEELRRRLEAGELTGDEYVQCEGMSDWQPLNLVLQQGYRVAPPPLPSSVTTAGPNQAVIWGIVALGIILFGVFISLVVKNARKGVLSVASRTQNINPSRPQAVAVASQPILWTTNTLTQADANRRARQFRIRQWLDGYKQRGEHNAAVDAEAEQFIRVWIARNYGGVGANNTMSLAAESDRLANNPACTDPLVLTVAANESANRADSSNRFERALAAFPESQHKAYPKFNAMVLLASQSGKDSARASALAAPALEQLKKCFADGSFTPDDQQEIGEIFVNGWADGFFSRNAPAVCQIVHEAGPNFHWLALALDGEREIAEAWAARGGGYANTVTDQGWQDFKSHLAMARNNLTEAWNLQRGFPLAPERMIYVELGDSDITEMRVWFDRTLAVQIDYPRAWSDFRWGLRPRWYGSEEALLALGKGAVATRRFDTDVPREFIECVSDVESEMNLPPGRHIFGRSDVWPDLQRVYEEYVNRAQRQHLLAWRTAYAATAYFAGKFEVARSQLEMLGWNPQPATLAQWRLDATLWPLEIAARTGPLAKEISAAETSYQNANFTEALKQYTELNSAAVTDARTGEFIRRRLASLQTGQPSPQSQLILPQQYHLISPSSTN
jgi:GYF domain 2